MTNERLALDLAAYLDRRIGDVDEERIRTDDLPNTARLYGIQVCDTTALDGDVDGAARFLCLAVGAPYSLLAALGVSTIERFDALGLSVYGSSTEIERPSLPRRAVRTTSVVVSNEFASALTFLDTGITSVTLSPVGELATVLGGLAARDDTSCEPRREVA